MRKVFALLLAMMVLGISSAAFAAVPDSWKVSAPAEGAKVRGSEVTLTIDPGEVKVVKPGPVAPGEGHWHFFRDGQEVGKGPVNTFKFTGLTPGKHTLRVELHQGDHTPYPGDKGREVSITVSLPNTGANVGIYAIAGAAMVGAAAYLFARKKVAA